MNAHEVGRTGTTLLPPDRGDAMSGSLSEKPPRGTDLARRVPVTPERAHAAPVTSNESLTGTPQNFSALGNSIPRFARA
jgi:hypothetical protein